MTSRLVRAVLGLAPVALMGCYTYTYAPVTPAPGTQLSLGLNDIGRAQLLNNVGPEVANVEGTLVSSADSQYVLKVSRTVTFRGQASTWAGEEVAIRFGYVGLVREKRFAPAQTVMLAGTVAAGLAAFVATRSIIGGGSGSTGDPGGGTNGQ